MTLDEFEARLGVCAGVVSDIEVLLLDTVEHLLRTQSPLPQSERDAARATEAALIKQLQAVVRERDNAKSTIEYLSKQNERCESDFNEIVDALWPGEREDEFSEEYRTTCDVVSEIGLLQRRKTTVDAEWKVKQELDAALYRADQAETTLRGKSVVLEDKLRMVAELKGELNKYLANAAVEMRAANEEAAKLRVQLCASNDIVRMHADNLGPIQVALCEASVDMNATGVRELVRQRDEARQEVKECEQCLDEQRARTKRAEARFGGVDAWTEIICSSRERDRCCRILEESKDLALGVGEHCAAIIRASVPA